MRISTCILALALASSLQVFAEEVKLEVWHRLSDHPTFEKRGEINVDIEGWLNYKQLQDQTAATSTFSRQKYQQQQKQKQQLKDLKPSPITYENIVHDVGQGTLFSEKFILNQRAPVQPTELEPEPTERETDEEGKFSETQEEFDQRREEWKIHKAEIDNEDLSLKTPGSYAVYEIMLKDSTRTWEAKSFIKSCLLVASDFQEHISLHVDQNRELFAFDYYTTASSCEEEHKKSYALESLDRFKSVKVDIATPVIGPKARYVKAQAIKIDTQTGKPEVEKTFLQKYWMYIVPFVLVMLLSGGEPEKPAS